MTDKYTLDETEIERQREIGKQLFLVSVLREENERASRGAITHISRETLAKGASMDRDDLDKFIDACVSLCKIKLEARAAQELAFGEVFRSEAYAYSYIMNTYLEYGTFVLLDLNLDVIKDYCEGEADEHYYAYNELYENKKVGIIFLKPEVFETILKHYIKYFVRIMNEVMGLGYDWDIINAMLGYQISKERFEILKDFVSAEGG